MFVSSLTPDEKGCLPQVAEGLKGFIHMDREDGQDRKRTSCVSCPSMLSSLVERGLALIVPEEKITVRKTIDCFVATFAIGNELWLLHNDRDFYPFEAHLALKAAHSTCEQAWASSS